VQDHTEPTAYNMTASEATSLYDLRRIWGDRYRISFTGGVWRACRLGNLAACHYRDQPTALKVVTADSDDNLRKWINEDYAQWQQAARRHNS
jgi:hypothetical protein